SENKISSAEIQKQISDRFYDSADLDVMIYSKTNTEFIDKMQHVIDTVSKNISELQKSTKTKNNFKKPFTVTSRKTLLIVVSLEFMKIKMKKWKPEYIIKNWNRPVIRNFFYNIYIKLKEVKTK